MITVQHVDSSRVLKSKIFDDLYRRYIRYAPHDIQFTRSSIANRSSSIRHYHRPHRELALLRPAIVTMHHDPLDQDPWLKPNFFLPRWKEADLIICLNRSQIEFLRGQGIEHAQLIPHGIDRSLFSYPDNARQITQYPIRLGIFSKLYERGVKGELLLEQLISTLDPRLYTFLFVGEGRLASAFLAKEKGFKVECYEFIPYHFYPDLYRLIDLLLITSTFEGGPACLPEALGMGIPVISTPVGMSNDWIHSGINGHVSRSDEFIDVLIQLANLDKLNQLCQLAFKESSKIPDWVEVFNLHHEIYRKFSD